MKKAPGLSRRVRVVVARSRSDGAFANAPPADVEEAAQPPPKLDARMYRISSFRNRAETSLSSAKKMNSVAESNSPQSDQSGDAKLD